MTPGPQLSVVIPTRARAGQLTRALERLDEQRSAPAFEVVVASDATDPDVAASRAATEGRGFSVRHVQAHRPGASAGRNAGWRASTGPVVLFLDDDVLAVEDLLAIHAAAHAAEPDRTVGVLGHIRWHPELRVTPFMRWLEHGIQFDYPSIVGDDAGWGRFYTANVSVKRALLEAVDGFDQDAFPFHYEDLDLARRAYDSIGFVLRYRPDAIGDHLHEVTLEDYAQRLAAIAPVEQRFVARYPDVRPYFHDLFVAAAAEPPARGLSARLAGVVRPGTPVVGPIAWASYDHVVRQRLAPAYLEAWEAALRE